MPSPVDYDLAVSTARRLAPAPPSVSWAEAGAIVTELRQLAVQAEEHVRAVTGLVPPGEVLEATVVDRPGWAAANVEGFRVVLEPLTRKLEEKSTSALAAGVTAKVAGVQMGSVLGWLSSKVLGQYEAFTAAGTPGRLIMVAPNIVETERRLEVDPHDFRLWVALHEVTHRTQFTAVPWMHDHVRGEITNLLEATSLDDPAQLVERLKNVVTGLPKGGSVVELLQTPEQRVVLDRVTAFMSLLEGHAEHVMDGVGPSVVPSVTHIRAKFDQRRKEHGGLLDRVLRKLLGMDLKALQYAEGKVFVDAAVRELGMAGFNRVWESPATLPTRQEIREPLSWVQRIDSTPAAITA
ncbi:MAG: coenzyme biosynthesis-associated protein [Frankiales bacterium]|nr:coenzyme biosynthesis-associated protein [Frankiales bacterium]